MGNPLDYEELCKAENNGEGAVSTCKLISDTSGKSEAFRNTAKDTRIKLCALACMFALPLTVVAATSIAHHSRDPRTLCQHQLIVRQSAAFESSRNNTSMVSNPGMNESPSCA